MITSKLRSATALSTIAMLMVGSTMLISGCTIRTNGHKPTSSPGAHPGQPRTGAPRTPPAPRTAPQTAPATQTQGRTDGRRRASGASKRPNMRRIGSPTPTARQPGAQPSQPAPASRPRATATAVPEPAGGGGTSAQACVDALNAASAKNCEDARALAQKCGTDQRAEIVAAVERSCPSH